MKFIPEMSTVSCTLNLKSTFLLLSLGRYLRLCWWTIY